MSSGGKLLVDLLATCSTGLEEVLAEEVKHKLLSASAISTDVANVRFSVPLADLETVQQLRCIERLWAVVLEKRDVLSGDVTEAGSDLKLLEDLAAHGKWVESLTAWARLCPDLASSLARQLASAGVQDFFASASCTEGKMSALRFRLKCNRSGPASGHVGATHGFSSQDAACSYGGAINETQGWTVSLSKGCFDIDICLHISRKDVRSVLKLTSLDGRVSGAALPPQRIGISALSATALRPAVAAALARLRRGALQVFPAGEVIVDPMCGCGTLGMEVAAGWPSFVVNGDLDPKELARFCYNRDQLGRAASNRKVVTGNDPGHHLQSNRRHHELRGQIEGVSWDAARLPLRTGAVDSFLSDLPWGKRVGSRESNQTFYPAAVREIARVLRTGGAALLLTKDTRLMARILDTVWARESFVQPWGSPRMVNIGGLRAALYGLERSTTVWLELKGIGVSTEFPAHAELQKVESLLCELPSGGASKNQRRKLNRQAWELRSSHEYLAEAKALGRQVQSGSESVSE
eukprot:TRINITY_DN13504_c0_g1_i1.p1 TRINITY_DN13504_c0_g1~~TRINITY_DN13504_c0_g1_i1.p1  ORF type:complete len:522 (-),score=50.38 TRINITY_DN13504_c0_g1_i1:68-1633(-)